MTLQNKAIGFGNIFGRTDSSFLVLQTQQIEQTTPDLEPDLPMQQTLDSTISALCNTLEFESDMIIEQYDQNTLSEIIKLI